MASDDLFDEPPSNKPPPPYRRLPGRMPTLRTSNYGRRKLYLGETELLQVEAVFFMENYRRFAYEDIQFLLLRQTPRGLIWSVVLGVLAAGFGGLVWSTDAFAGKVTFGVFAGIFVLLLLFNLVRGATCRCHLQTAVGPYPLPSLSRMRPARRALALIAERVTAAQGALTPADAAARVDGASVTPAGAVGGGANQPEGAPVEKFDY